MLLGLSSLAHPTQLFSLDISNLTNVPLFCSQQFKKNLKGVNGNKDFDQDMLEDMYAAIK